jgi:cystathionine beta-synthase
MRIHSNIIETIGNTPLVQLNRVTKGIRAQVVAKLEYFNPGGSVKDRIGVEIIDEYERIGKLKPGGTIVEATSGNTGVGLALVAALRGYKTVFVMPDKMSQEKILLLRAYGARVVITPTNVEPDNPESYYSVARRIVQETPNSVLANQYHNPANPLSHEHTTGPEIWQQTDGTVDVFICGVGTGGTISGVAKYLKAQNPGVKIVGVDPVGSLLYHHFHTREMGPAHGYKIEGIGEDFLPSTYDYTLLDDMVQVNDREAYLMTRRLVREEGIFCGSSGGAAVAGALHWLQANPLDPDQLVVVLIPDSGSRYLSKAFNDDWLRENQLLESSRSAVSVNDLLQRAEPHEIITAHCDDTIESVINKMRDHGISQLPVVDEDNHLLGLVEEVAVLKYLLASPESKDAAHAQVKDTNVINDTITITSDTPLDSLLSIFSTNSAVVVQDNGSIKDIVTKIDLLDFLAHAEG